LNAVLRDFDLSILPSLSSVTGMMLCHLYTPLQPNVLPALAILLRLKPHVPDIVHGIKHTVDPYDYDEDHAETARYIISYLY
jgi:hypothetical protein